MADASLKRSTSKLRRLVRECPVQDCGVMIPRERFVCTAHWAQLPTAMQQRVIIAYRQFTADVAQYPALRAAQTAAVEFIQSHQAQVLAAPDVPIPTGDSHIFEGETRNLLAVLTTLAERTSYQWVQVLTARGAIGRRGGRRWLVVALRLHRDNARTLAIGMKVAPLTLSGRAEFEADVQHLLLEMGCRSWRRLDQDAPRVDGAVLVRFRYPTVAGGDA